MKRREKYKKQSINRSFDDVTNLIIILVVVSFRGTEADSLRNWIIDLESIVFVPYKNVTGVEVGDGFYNEWNDLMPQVIPAVQTLRDQFPNYQIWVTGHSLGGMLFLLLISKLIDYVLITILFEFCKNYYNVNSGNLYFMRFRVS